MLAFRYFSEALVILQEIGDFGHELILLGYLARLSTLLGDYALAEPWFAQCRQSVEKVESSLAEYINGLFALTLFSNLQQNHMQALSYAEESQQIAQQLAAPNHLAHALILIGHARAGLQQWDVAATAYD